MSPSTTDQVLQLVAEERKRQLLKRGKRSHTDGDWLLILIEELGEASRDLLGGEHLFGAEELVQAAAVLVAWIEDMVETQNIRPEPSPGGEMIFSQRIR